MFDTMTITKAGGAICAALLLFLLAGWAAEELYAIDHHDADHVSGYRVALPEEDDASEPEAEPEIAFSDVYAVADAAAGEGLWRQCSACHALSAGQNGVGPYLAGVVDRPIASVDGFNYSDALNGLGGDWTPESLSGFLEDPRGYATGTAMSYRGLADVEDRANLIAYLATQ